MPPVSALVVFTHGKRLSANLISVTPQPCRRLVLLRESPALALLPVPPLQRLPAGCLYLIPHFPVLGDHVVIYRLPLLVDAFHILPFLPRIADRVSFESTLSNCLFVLVFQPHLYADALTAGVRELVRLHPFCNIPQRHNLMVLCLIVDTGKVAAYTAMVLFHCH